MGGQSVQQGIDANLAGQSGAPDISQLVGQVGRQQQQPMQWPDMQQLQQRQQQYRNWMAGGQQGPPPGMEVNPQYDPNFVDTRGQFKLPSGLVVSDDMARMADPRSERYITDPNYNWNQQQQPQQQQGVPPGWLSSGPFGMPPWANMTPQGANSISAFSPAALAQISGMYGNPYLPEQMYANTMNTPGMQGTATNALASGMLNPMFLPQMSSGFGGWGPYIGQGSGLAGSPGYALPSFGTPPGTQPAPGTAPVPPQYQGGGGAQSMSGK